MVPQGIPGGATRYTWLSHGVYLVEALVIFNKDNMEIPDLILVGPWVMNVN